MSDNTKIEWTEVPGYSGYRVTREGKISGPSGRVLTPMVSESGHLHVITGDRRKLRVHHAVLLTFVGPRPEGHVGRHLDDDPTNNVVENLQWGTVADNAADRKRNGRYTSGSQRVNSRLTERQARAIRVDCRPARAVAAEYGVSHTCILRIRRGERWAAA